MDEREWQSANAWVSIAESLDPDSKETIERERQFEKQPSARVWTNEGMEIDVRDKQSANVFPSIHKS
jgi:hypothetical protein